MENLEIRQSLSDDFTQIEKIYQNAFPDEDLVPLITELLQEVPGVISLVGILDRTVVAHVIFTTCSIAGNREKTALLGPLAVAPPQQRKGIGDAIVRAGLQQMENADIKQVLVLGDPAYYRRFGFVPDNQISPPYPLPDEWHDAWQSLPLGNDHPFLSGRLMVPKPWRTKSLWCT